MIYRSYSTQSIENPSSSTQSKEVNIINNNILSNQRVFGKELSNYNSLSGLDNHKKHLSKPLFGLLNQKNSSHTSSHSHLHINTSNRDIDIPKTTRDPLLSNPHSSHSMETLIEKKHHANKSMSIDIYRSNSTQSAPSDMEETDLQELKNPQYVALYAKEIFEYLRTTEDKYLAKPNYMKTQTDINEKMRAILVDWLVDVHIKFKLLPETLFLAVNLTDRYVEKVPVARQKLQLVGVASMLIASKYEEIYPPEVKDFVYVTDKAYSREEVLEMEGKILGSLGFHLTITSSLRFLERYSKLAKMDPKAFNMCRYMLELAMVEYKMLKYVPSMLASAAMYIVNKMNKKEAWPEVLNRNTKHDESTVKGCAKDMLVMLQGAENSQLQAVRRKFSNSKLNEVAKINFDFSSLSL